MSFRSHKNNGRQLQPIAKRKNQDNACHDRQQEARRRRTDERIRLARELGHTWYESEFTITDYEEGFSEFDSKYDFHSDSDIEP